MRWHIYKSPIYSPFSFFFTPIKGEHGPLCILAIAVTVVQPGFVNGGQSKGAKRPSGGRVWEGGFHGREIFENSCMKTAFSCTLNTIIRGSLCTGTNSLLFFFFHSFPIMNLFQGNIFLFLFPFSFFFFFFFYSPINRGGPLVPPSLATPVMIMCLMKLLLVY